MFLKVHLDHRTRQTYRYDALGNVAGATIAAIVSTFGLVLAKRADAPIWLISFGVAGMFVPSLLAWLVPCCCRRLPVGAVILCFRLLAGLTMLPAIISPSLETFLLGYILALICIGLADYTYPALLQRLYQPEEQRVCFSFTFALRATLMLLMFLALGPILDTLSAQHGFRLLGVVCIALAALSAGATWRFRGVRENEAAAQCDMPAASPWANPMFVRYLVILTVFGIGNAAFNVLWPIMAVNPFGLSNAQVGLLQSLSMLSQLAAYSWFNRFGKLPRSLQSTAAIFLFYALPCVVAVGLLHSDWSQAAKYWTLLVSMVLFNFAAGIWAMYFYLLVNAMAGDGSPLPYHATQGVVVGVRGLIIPFACGAIYSRAGLEISLWLTAAFFLAASVVAVLSGGFTYNAAQEQRQAESKVLAMALERSAE